MFAWSFLTSRLGQAEAKQLAGLPLVVVHVDRVSAEIQDITPVLQAVGDSAADQRQLMVVGPVVLNPPLREIMMCLIL